MTRGAAATQGMGIAAFSRCVLACALVLWARTASADGAGALSVVDALVGDSGQLVFVGSSGELYEPAPENRWQRRAVGGVSTDVLGAVRAGRGKVYAIGASSPIFEWDGSVWSARPLANRGTIQLSRGGGVAGFAVGRHVYLLQKGSWERAVSASRSLAALWVQSAQRIYAVTNKGELLRGNGKSWSTLKTSLGTDDAVVNLVGGGKSVYAVSRTGAVLSLSGTSPARVELGNALSGLDIHAWGAGTDGGLLVAGTVGAGETRRSVLISGASGKLEIADELWPLPEGDRFAVVAATGGELVVASRGGSLRIRAKDGTWREGSISPDPPARSREPDRASAPARAR